MAELYWAHNVQVVKSLIAACGCAALAWFAFQSHLKHRLLGALLAVVCSAALAGWWNFFWFHHGQSVHYWEMFHHVIGAKYFNELGYRGLYTCTSAAVRRNSQETIVVRSLKTGGLTRSTTEHERECKAKFSAERWAAFSDDVAFFRQRLAERWPRVLSDHGYNASPLWTAVLGAFLQERKITNLLLVQLAMIDVVLLLVLWGVVFRVFGLYPAAAALLFWSAAYPCRYYWVGGAVVRHEWFACLLLGLAAIRVQRFRWGGMLLGLATISKLFPVVCLAALLMKAARGSTNSVGAWAYKVGFGVSLSALIAVVVTLLSPVVMTESWRDFIENTRRVAETPFTNKVGLVTAATSFSGKHRAAHSAVAGAVDPLREWRGQRRELQRETLWWRMLIFAALALLYWRALPSLNPWMSAALAVAFVPFAVGLTGYYLAVLAPLGLLWERSRIVGLCVAITGWASGQLGLLLVGYEVQAYLQSILFCACTLFAILAIERSVHRSRCHHTQLE